MTEKSNATLWGSGFLALAYLLALGYLVSLLATAETSVATIIELAVLGIAGFAILLFGIAVAFRGMDALDPQQAFGLPRGTVRAILALGLLVVFLAGSFYWTDRAATHAPLQVVQKVLEPGAVANLAEIQKALGPEVAVFLTTETKIVKETTKDHHAQKGDVVPQVKTRQVVVQTLNFVDRAANKEWLDLVKQIVTVLATALSAVIGFYFGSRSSDSTPKLSLPAAAADAENGKEAAQTESARELMATITTDVQRAKNAVEKVKAAHEAAKKSGVDAIALAVLVSNLENAEKVYRNALAVETKSRALVSSIEEAAAKLTATGVTAEQAAAHRDEITKALKTLKQQSALAQAAGDRAQKLAGWSDQEPAGSSSRLRTHIP